MKKDVFLFSFLVAITQMWPLGGITSQCAYKQAIGSTILYFNVASAKPNSGEKYAVLYCTMKRIVHVTVKNCQKLDSEYRLLGKLSLWIYTLTTALLWITFSLWLTVILWTYFYFNLILKIGPMHSKTYQTSLRRAVQVWIKPLTLDYSAAWFRWVVS